MTNLWLDFSHLVSLHGGAVLSFLLLMACLGFVLAKDASRWEHFIGAWLFALLFAFAFSGMYRIEWREVREGREALAKVRLRRLDKVEMQALTGCLASKPSDPRTGWTSDKDWKACEEISKSVRKEEERVKWVSYGK